MATRQYTSDPMEVYKLELEKLQRCFSEIQKIGEGASELSRVSWHQVEHLRQVNFMLLAAAQTGEDMLQLPV